MKGPVKVLEFQMYLDDLDSLRLAERGVHEPEETAFFRRTVQPGDGVIDIGAMIGYYTLLFAHLVGVDGKVFAFEPEPKNFAVLAHNIELNRLQNIEAFQVAVLEERGPSKLYLSAENNGDHRCFDSGGWPRVLVNGVDLDSFEFLDDQRISFVKIDTQGAELRVLRGMEEFLQKHEETKLVIEFAPWWLHGAATDPMGLLAFLANRGFAFYEVGGAEIGASRLLEAFPMSSQSFVNLVCLRRDAELLAR